MQLSGQYDNGYGERMSNDDILNSFYDTKFDERIKEYVAHFGEEYLKAFDKMCNVRKKAAIVGYYHYGNTKQNCLTKVTIMLKNADIRVKAYKKDKNTEGLCDAVNYCMFEQMWPQRSGGGMYKKLEDNLGIFNGCYDRLEMYKKSIEKYGETGNFYYLVIASVALVVEFTRPMIDGAHFKATDDCESPGIYGVGVKQIAEFGSY